MKKVLVLALLICSLALLTARRIDFDNPDYDTELELLKETATGIELGYSAKGFNITDIGD